MRKTKNTCAEPYITEPAADAHAEKSETMYSVTVMMGRLVADPELRHTQNEVAVATFRVAVDRPYKRDGQTVTDFFNIVAWRGLGEFTAENFKKGKPILIQGSFQNRTYKNKDGEKRYTTELIADRISFAGDSSKNSRDNSLPEPPPERGESTPQYANSADGDFEEIPSDDDLPF